MLTSKFGNIKTNNRVSKTKLRTTLFIPVDVGFISERLLWTWAESNHKKRHTRDAKLSENEPKERKAHTKYEIEYHFWRLNFIPKIHTILFIRKLPDFQFESNRIGWKKEKATLVRRRLNSHALVEWNVHGKQKFSWNTGVIFWCTRKWYFFVCWLSFCWWRIEYTSNASFHTWIIGDLWNENHPLLFVSKLESSFGKGGNFSVAFMVYRLEWLSQFIINIFNRLQSESQIWCKKPKK